MLYMDASSVGCRIFSPRNVKKVSIDFGGPAGLKSIRFCISALRPLLWLGFYIYIYFIFHIPFRSIISHGWFNPEIVDPRRGDFCHLQANKMAVLWVIPTCVALPAGPWDASGNWRPWKPWSFYR